MQRIRVGSVECLSKLQKCPLEDLFIELTNSVIQNKIAILKRLFLGLWQITKGVRTRIF